MSDEQFDDLTRSAGGTVSRSQVLKKFAGGLLAVAASAFLFGNRATAAGPPGTGPGCRVDGELCVFNTQCCTSLCQNHCCGGICSQHGGGGGGGGR